jgi:hypothetical protein
MVRFWSRASDNPMADSYGRTEKLDREGKPALTDIRLGSAALKTLSLQLKKSRSLLPLRYEPVGAMDGLESYAFNVGTLPAGVAVQRDLSQPREKRCVKLWIATSTWLIGSRARVDAL